MGRRVIDSIYSRLPIALQNMACSWKGRQLLRHRYSGEFRELLTWLKESQWRTCEELREYQDEQLRKLIEHAYETVPYYSRIMRQKGLKPKDIQTAEDIRKLPILTKHLVRQAGKDMFSKTASKKNSVISHTSGTTGAGLKFAVSKRAIRFQWAVWWRHRSRFGVELCQPHVNFSGRMVVPLQTKSPPFWRENRPLKQTYVSLYHMSPENMPAYVEMLENRQFKYFAGYPSAIYILADYLRSISHKLTSPPEIIITGAESLLPFQVQAFEEWIGSPVTDQYGLSEGCANLSQCEQGNLHEDMEFAIIERDEIEHAPDGKICKIIGTSLHNYAIPFIRYDTGDIATFADEPCPCGLHAPHARCIDGRIESYLVTPENKRVMRLARCFKEMTNIREAQLVQDTVDAVTVNVVKMPQYGPNDETQLENELRERLGESIRIEFNYVDSIPRSRTGKFRAVISNLKSDNMPNLQDMSTLISEGLSPKRG